MEQVQRPDRVVVAGVLREWLDEPAMTTGTEAPQTARGTRLL